MARGHGLDGVKVLFFVGSSLGGQIRSNVVSKTRLARVGLIALFTICSS